MIYKRYRNRKQNGRQSLWMEKKNRKLIKANTTNKKKNLYYDRKMLENAK